ncbi:MAG: zinc metalloprotease [Chitinophagales bacterium]
MKKLILVSSAVAMLFSACQKNALTDNTDTQSAITKRSCGSMEVLAEQMKADPTLEARLNAYEAAVQDNIKKMEAGTSNFRLVNGVIEIPVVVNVLYRTAAENVSQAQIQSQIDVLNEDYNATNADFSLVPATFSGVKANVGIRFVLDQVIRKSTTKTSWKTDDAMKKSTKGGINPTSPTTKLNLWVCTLSGGILGYAQFPGGASATDGVVILNTGFGRTGTAAAPYNKGRTATHEVGHWLNLRHIWGDATCGSDLVNDTPLHNTANYGCPAAGHKSTCTGTPIEMTMNYMDYTDDACMYMFSAGQKARILATFATGGPRATFAQ